MKQTELSQLEMESFLPVCYEGIKPHLIATLNSLRAALILLPDSVEKETIASLFIQSIQELNRIHKDPTIGSIVESVFMKDYIDTEEREGLCEALEKMCEIVGLYEGTAIDDFVDEWRTW